MKKHALHASRVTVDEVATLPSGYGFRKNKDGQKGDDTRIQMGFQYRF